MANNIKIIDAFLDKDDFNILILSKVSDEINQFYKILIQRLSKTKDYQCNFVDKIKDLENLNSNDLFDEKKIFVLEEGRVPNEVKEYSKKNSTNKFFVFLPYGIFKKENRNTLNINAYDYKKDMFFFVEERNYKKLEKNQVINLLDICYSEPHIFFSELDKASINYENKPVMKKNYKEDLSTIRKKIFQYKSNFQHKDLSLIYESLKKDIEIKKFNF